MLSVCGNLVHTLNSQGYAKMYLTMCVTIGIIPFDRCNIWIFNVLKCVHENVGNRFQNIGHRSIGAKERT
jgi:hypothetical protein